MENILRQISNQFCISILISVMWQMFTNKKTSSDFLGKQFVLSLVRENKLLF